jgi:hypothetical protein
MASTSRTFDSRTSATTNATSNQGTSNRGTMRTSARERVLINAAKTEAQLKTDMAEKEKAQRTEPIAGSVAGYDAVTGDWQVRTPSGGIVRAQLMSDGSPTGKLLPVQRFANSQTSALNAPPSGNGGGGGNVLTQITAAQRDVVNLLALEQIDVAIDVPANRDYLITYSQRYPCRIEALHYSPVAYTVALSPPVGTAMEVGGQIILTLSGIPDGEDDEPPPPISLSIELRRLG